MGKGEQRTGNVTMCETANKDYAYYLLADVRYAERLDPGGGSDS